MRCVALLTCRDNVRTVLHTKFPENYTTLEYFLYVPISKNSEHPEGSGIPIGDVFFNTVMVLSQQLAGYEGRSMPPFSDRRRKMAFNRLKSSSFPSEKQKWNRSGERVHSRGVTTTTVIDVEGDMPPPPKGMEDYTKYSSGKFSKRHYSEQRNKGQLREWGKNRRRGWRSRYGYFRLL